MRDYIQNSVIYIYSGSGDTKQHTEIWRQPENGARSRMCKVHTTKQETLTAPQKGQSRGTRANQAGGEMRLAVWKPRVQTLESGPSCRQCRPLWSSLSCSPCGERTLFWHAQYYAVTMLN